MSFRFYPQYDVMDCGPACLRMVAADYGKLYPLELLRNYSNMSRLGVSLLGVSEAAEKIGFRTTGVKIEFKKLCDTPLPCIVHWNQQHFVVVYDPLSRICSSNNNKQNIELPSFFEQIPRKTGYILRIITNRTSNYQVFSNNFLNITTDCSVAQYNY